MRIIAGKFKGKALLAPKDQTIRPTSDRLRESLFNILAHGYDRAVDNARVLDLFAGTGALAIEAMSRGAVFAVMVDDGVEARGLQRGNVEVFGLGGSTKILRRDATKLGAVSPFDPFTLVFLDPPYGKGLGERAMRSAIDGGWLAPNALVVWEERKDVDILLPPELTFLDRREAGEGQIVIARKAG